MFADDQLTQNAFLGGRLTLFQPRDGYRAGVDPVLLASAVPARAGQSVLELGCGAGAAVLSLLTRVGGVRGHGVELQPEYADLARRNAAQNKLLLDVTCADLSALPDEVRQQRFNHVIANPPYYRSGAHSPARDIGRSVALGGATPLATWVEVAARRLLPKGYLHVIQRIDRLPDLISACTGRLGSLEVLPLAARPGRAPALMILRARKEGKSPFRLHAPQILHHGDHHTADVESYVPEIRAVLRDGAILNWPALR
ncbi:tRNA1(Val) (adenine(37)-N6)-methyltransferase [Tropicibacter sp. Alg240-R139]|uniref:tRNA1(Val) (adenine(37)-N6)-methyltransferase n=1 Tax=Tropicibacter sp. Alg240-R139 TaxID=2305991 RepID=UPI0013DEC255|nr:methyltransferase domain-containing protein [Tropicibacter sp. Alg240-R139]